MSEGNHFDERYRTNDAPWDSGIVEEALVRAIEAGALPSPPGRLLEIGCGTGTNARYASGRGYAVVGIDASPIAVERARAETNQGSLHYEVADVLRGPIAEAAYDVVFDRGCFHVFDDPEARRLFAARVAKALVPGGVWLTLVGSGEAPTRPGGPPRRTATEIAEAIEPSLEILELTRSAFSGDPARPTAWCCLSRRREPTSHDHPQRSFQ